MVGAVPHGGLGLRVGIGIGLTKRTRDAYIRWYATPVSRRTPLTQIELAKILVGSDDVPHVNAMLRDFIGFESDPSFGQDVHNAAAEVALEGLSSVIEAAEKNALDAKHPRQAEWVVLYLRIVQYPIGDVGDIAKAMQLPDKVKHPGKRISRRG